MGTFDSRLLAQAFGNVVKNAAESIEAVERKGGEPGAIRIEAGARNGMAEVNVIDNGKGLPRENRQRLLEPYMTTREKGTGLGLAIVKKIVEDHGGRLELHDAPPEFHEGRGAMIRFILPLATEGGAATEEGGAAHKEPEQVGNGI
jgi:two-component system nitrogen regulation sensor histidine kinase NtrY